MSHYTCLVIGENPEEQLAPFNEQPDDKDSPYLVFVDKTEEVQKAWLENKIEKFHDDKEMTLHERYIDIYDYAEKYYGYKYYRKTKKFGYKHNPNAKWDWFSLGGRWRGSFKLKYQNVFHELGETGAFDNKPIFDADQAYKKDIDFIGMKEANKARYTEYYDKLDPEEKLEISKEQYAENNSDFSTFAVLKDGKWYERGEMGWWCIVSNEKDKSIWQQEFNKLINGLPGDTLLSVFDCHI